MLDAAYYFNINEQYFYRGKGLKIPSLQDIFTKFILDIKSPDADPKIMANMPVTLIDINNMSDNVMIYSTEIRYLRALPDHITKFEPRYRTRKILANTIMANECQNPTSDGFATVNVKYHAFELRRDVKVIEELTLRKAGTWAKLVWNQQAMNCFKKNNDTKVLLIGINSADDYQIAKDLNADYVMVDSPATAQHWQ
jgi:glycerophosphoryl diester phosphodiesterase